VHLSGIQSKRRLIARATLGEEAFTTAWEEGKKMTFEEAVKFALEES
jgi:hypothetical protein